MRWLMLAGVLVVLCSCMHTHQHEVIVQRDQFGELRQVVLVYRLTVGVLFPSRVAQDHIAQREAGPTPLPRDQGWQP